MFIFAGIRTKHNQIGLKAYGLLPIIGTESAVDRYLSLRKAWKEATKYGTERQANTRAAVIVGLKNLAQRAGYRDAARMEWDLESQASEQAKEAFSDQAIGNWDVSVSMDGLKSRLSVSKSGKLLKSVPAGLRKMSEYKEIREQMKVLDEQARRFRVTLEEMMCQGEPLLADELRKLSGITAVRFLLGNLLGIDSVGHIGWIDSTSNTLIGFDETRPIEGALRIAHVEDLFWAGVLSDWQKKVVEKNCVQPFKQAFRELYLLTPEELDSSPVSRRFDARTVKTSIANRLLQGRSWRSEGIDGSGTCYRSFGSSGYVVHWACPNIGHFFTEDQMLVTGEIHFVKDRKRVELSSVPTRIFSEAMRDADLVVSVALMEGYEDYWSPELSKVRMSVVENVLTKLGFDNFRIEDQFLYVKGKRAEYRIHLGSGHIHIVPGLYLCVLADHRVEGDPIYLPFSDSDPKVAEIISKAILLTEDDCIEDLSIKGQIDRAVL